MLIAVDLLQNLLISSTTSTTPKPRPNRAIARYSVAGQDAAEDLNRENIEALTHARAEFPLSDWVRTTSMFLMILLPVGQPCVMSSGKESRLVPAAVWCRKSVAVKS
jgi:hypothetical protein